MIQILSIARSPRNRESRKAFTLIELLIAVGIAVILGTATFTVMKGATRSGELAREMNAGKTLITAYLNYAAENDGRLMVGLYETSRVPESELQGLSFGPEISGWNSIIQRYPFRLSAYFDQKIEGTLLVNQNRQKIPEVFQPKDLAYATSLCPAFGINHYFTAYVSDNEVVNPSECVQRLSQSPKPSQMLIFATAATPDADRNGTRIEGRHTIHPPAYRAVLWDSELYVDPRHGGKALCVFLDGSVRSHTIGELRDMRYWSPMAQSYDDANYRVPVQGSGGLGGGGGGGRR